MDKGKNRLASATLSDSSMNANLIKLTSWIPIPVFCEKKVM